MMISFTKIKMSQIQQYYQQQYQDYISNPLNYFANTPRSIQRRKHQATRQSNMKIVDFTQNPHNNSFEVLIKGNRGITYIVFFSERAITCSCPDFHKHTVKPICKHMFKLICLSENHDIFNNSMLLTDLMNPQYLERILTSTLRIIDVKKMERYGGPQNQISIERDECCPVCYGDFDVDISKCSKCEHVFHTNCVLLSWNSASYSSYGKCPMCREPNSFPQLGGLNNNDPWEIYNFSFPDAVEEVPAQYDILQLSEVEQNENSNIPIQVVAQNDINNAFFQNEPVFPVEENNLNTPPSSPPPFPSIEESNSSLIGQEEQEDNDEIIESRIKILNISLFIFETMNIIINHILYPLEE
jgi:hypothetical protein